ncbi:hypothetical protein QZH41_019922, partial [Actinostola sp. cb2023]
CLKLNMIVYLSLSRRKNVLKPFEDQTSLEFFSVKNDASLFAYGSHSKKRPHNLVLGKYTTAGVGYPVLMVGYLCNLVLGKYKHQEFQGFGRIFDGHVLDMIELGIVKFKSLQSFQTRKCTVGTKPCLLFTGEAFETDTEYKRLKNLLIDLFRGSVIEQVRLQGLEHVIQVTAVEKNIFLRSYRTVLKKSGGRVPRVELEEMGPAFDFTLRRTRLASDDLMKSATKVPKVTKANKVKNVGYDVFGTKTGRVHMTRQDYGKLQTRKLKGLKRGQDDDKTVDEVNNKRKKE